MAPSSQRPPLNPSVSSFLIRAEQSESSNAEPVADLKPESGSVCSGTPDFTGTYPLKTPQPDAPVFVKDRKNAVLSLIRYPWRDLGYEIVFLGPRPGYRAMTLTGRRRIEVYVRPGEGLMHQAYDLAHELGHAFDLKYNDSDRRKKWLELRGIKPSTPWFGCDACPDYRTPAGDFAETFSYLLLGPGNYHSLMAPMPDIEKVEELARFCKIDQLSEVLSARLPKKTSPSSVQSAKTEKRGTSKKREDTAEASARSVIEESAPDPAQAQSEVSVLSVPADGKTDELPPLVPNEPVYEPNIQEIAVPATVPTI